MLASFSDVYYQSRFLGVAPGHHFSQVRNSLPVIRTKLKDSASQGHIHFSLDSTEKRYTELTKVLGLIDAEDKLQKEGPAGERQAVEGHTTEGKAKDGEGQVKRRAEPTTEILPVFSSGRQRFGDTRSLPFYPLSTTILTEYWQ